MIESSGLTLYGIIGHPVGHSLSPVMHNASFEALGLHATMEVYDIKPESLKDALESFIKLGFGGINVTIPHKQTIIPFLDDIDEEAGIIGAVNTVRFRDGRTEGFNTDAHGFRQTLEPYRSSIEGSRFVVLGAGGAARAVTYVLLRFFRTAQIVIAARTASGSKTLVEHFKGFHGSRLAASTLDDPHLSRMVRDSEVIINATPVGMFPKTGEAVVEGTEFRDGQTVVDLIYRPLQTELLRRAKQHGARAVSGLEMFIHQGARAFEIWTGKGMDIDRVRILLTGMLEQETSRGEGRR